MKGRKTGGRKKGVPNKLTATMKQILEWVLQDTGGAEAMSAWVKKNDRNRLEFYRICARLIPAEIHAQVETRIVDESRIQQIRDELREASQTSTVQ